MESDRDQVLSEAVARLEQELTTLVADVRPAVRWCWYRHPSFSAALLTESVRLRFGDTRDVRRMTQFVTRVRANSPGSVLGFPSREAEALMRASLGEIELLEAVSPATFSYPEIAIAILTQLFLEWQPTPAEVRALFARVEAVLAQAHGLIPGLEEQLDDWYAEGMHESPFLTDWTKPPGDGP